MALKHEEITGQVIGAAYEVYRVLGYGFLEKVEVEAALRDGTRCGCGTTSGSCAEILRLEEIDAR
jgi:PD-(D/E)XK nuclease superfamily